MSKVENLADYKLHIDIDPTVATKNKAENQASTSRIDYIKLYENEFLTAYYPQNPRVPHHITIVMNSDSSGIDELSLSEYQSLHAFIKKVNEIYVNQLNLDGYVIAEYSHPQKRHDGKCVVELLPNYESSTGVRNFLDKYDSNRYVLFNDEPLTTLADSIVSSEYQKQVNFWQQELVKEQEPLPLSKLNSLQLPVPMKDSHMKESQLLGWCHLIEVLEQRGAHVINRPQTHYLATKESQDTRAWSINKCAFCDTDIVKKQLVCEYNDLMVLYNVRKTPEPGSLFLIVPKRHVEKTYSLTADEIEHMHTLKTALIHVLEKKHPKTNVIIYTQDGASVGQTVPHTHNQVLAANPDQIALTWTMISLNYNTNPEKVSDQEMQAVTQEYRQLLEEELSVQDNLLKEAS